MSLIKVFTEVENGVTKSLPAKIIDTNGDKYKIVYMSPSENKDSHNKRIYKYEDEIYEITDESITEYLDTDSELDLGFKKISDNEFIKYDSDSDDDYTPSSEDEDSDSDGSSDEESNEYSDSGGESFYDDDSN